jgi:galactokinase
MSSLQQKVANEFKLRFAAAPRFVVRAPGRVNLIGEHTDYNDGFVLPMAIDRAVWIALRPRDDARVVIHSLDFHETTEFALDGEMSRIDSAWGKYLQGVAWALRGAGHTLRGWDGLVIGDVPIGAGLSSSAATELAAARAFAAVSDLDWDAGTMAKLCQKAENQWVGVNSGIMDQMISAAGQNGHALLIDCRSLETRAVPLPANTSIVVMDTQTRRTLVDSAYNERRKQCEAAARFYDVKSLRDLSPDEFNQKAHLIDNLTRKRARHVVTEIDRTVHAAHVLLGSGDDAAFRFGLLMNASHDSLRDDFAVTNDALNVIVDCARKAVGCYGARMTGAGFGGCAVALVDTAHVDAFRQEVTAGYEQHSGLHPELYVCTASAGAQIVSENGS